MSKVTKKQLQRDIELLESGIGMNWSDMKKIETRLNHAMNEMAQQLEALEEFATYADNMLTELNHALPDPDSLIERDTAKELEVNLSSELTGSELCKAMINRGDKIVLCIVRDYEHEDDTYYDAITHCSDDYFESSLSYWRYAVPINPRTGEPLTQAEAGL